MHQRDITVTWLQLNSGISGMFGMKLLIKDLQDVGEIGEVSWLVYV